MTHSLHGIAMCDQPSLSHHPKCTRHPYSLLTGEGVCPTCHHATIISAPEKVSTKHVLQPSAKQKRARELDAKISRGKSAAQKRRAA